MKLKITKSQWWDYYSKLTKSSWIFFFKFLKLRSKQILQIIFSKRWLDCIKNMIVHNFLITNPNRMNQMFPYIQKYFLWEPKYWKFYFEFLGFLLCTQKLVLDLGWYKFCSHTSLQRKIYSQKANVFYYLQKISKNDDKNWNHGTYPKFLLSHGTLGINPLRSRHRKSACALVNPHCTLKIATFGISFKLSKWSLKSFLSIPSEKFEKFEKLKELLKLKTPGGNP